MSIPSTTTPLTQVCCMIRATSSADSVETMTLTRYKLASIPQPLPPAVITLRPPSFIAALLALDSLLTFDSFHALDPFRALDGRRASDFLLMYGFSSGLPRSNLKLLTTYLS